MQKDYAYVVAEDRSYIRNAQIAMYATGIRELFLFSVVYIWYYWAIII